MSTTVSRPDKLTDAQTILYEVDMFRFAASRLLRGVWECEKDRWTYLESFLLHYRNLIEFLGKEQARVSATDLHVSNIWQRLGVPEPPQLPRIIGQGSTLWTKYERVRDKISVYLHHCTTLRTESKSWDLDEMNNDMEPVVAEVEKALRQNYCTWTPERPVVSLSATSCSTATVGTCAALVQTISLPVPPKSK